jgi:hypothetical protein
MGLNPQCPLQLFGPAARGERKRRGRVWSVMATALPLRDEFREHWRDLKRGRPGSRFEDRYERARRRERAAGKRIILLAAGIGCFAIGVVLSVIPGPAILFFMLAGGLLASESRFVARAMDWSELKLRKLVAWAKQHWKRMSPATRVAVVALALCCLAAAAFVGYRLLGG